MRLDNAAYWDDEAHVALCARNFLATGTTTAWDGRNLIPDNNGAGLTPRLTINFVQLDHYWVAAFFRVFGESAWTGRFAMAVCGIGALLVFRRLLRLEFPAHPVLRLYALAASALSTNLLLYSRNCRYYSISLLLTLWLFCLYRSFVGGGESDWSRPGELRPDEHGMNPPSRAIGPLLGLAGGLLVLANVLNGISVLGALALRHALFHRDAWTRRHRLQALLAGAVLASIALPYLALSVLPAMEMGRKLEQATAISPRAPWLWARLVIFVWNLEGFSLINALPWTLAVTLLVFLRPAGRASAPDDEWTAAPRLRELAATLVAFSFTLALATPQNIWSACIPEVRYLTPALPLAALLSGGALWFIHQRTPIVALTLLTALVASNILSLAPGVPFRWMLPAWIRETTAPYPTAVGEAAAWLRTHARRDDTVWFCPAYMGKPLQFALGDHVKFRGVLDRKTVLDAGTVRRIRQLDPALFLEEARPDWVVAFGKPAELASALEQFARMHSAAPEARICLAGQQPDNSGPKARPHCSLAQRARSPDKNAARAESPKQAAGGHLVPCLQPGISPSRETTYGAAIGNSVAAPLTQNEHKALPEESAPGATPRPLPDACTSPLATTLDIFWAQTQRPELVWHEFSPRRDFDRQTEAVFIFRRTQNLPKISIAAPPDSE